MFWGREVDSIYHHNLECRGKNRAKPTKGESHWTYMDVKDGLGSFYDAVFSAGTGVYKANHTVRPEISCVNVFPSGVSQHQDLHLESKENLMLTLGINYNMLWSLLVYRL